MYTMETWLYHYVNQAGRDKDESKVMMLGPYAAALSFVLMGGEVRGRNEDPESIKPKNPKNLG